MLKLFFSFSLFFCSYLCFSQGIEKYKDSITIEIQKITSDSIKAERFYKESKYALRRLSDIKLCRTYLDSSVFYSKTSGLKDVEAKCHLVYGLLERLSGNYDKALMHLEKNLAHFEKDSTAKSYALYQVAEIQRNQGNYEGSLATYLEILNIFEHKKDSSAIASTYNGIANIYGDMDNYDNAISNYLKAIAHTDETDLRSRINTYRNVSEIYLRKEDTLTSREYANKCLVLAKEFNEDFSKGISYYMLARTYLNIDNDKALDNYMRAKILLEKINFKKVLIAIYNDLGNLYSKINSQAESVKYYGKALNILQDTNDLLQAKITYKGLYLNYVLQGNYKKAFEFQSLYLKVNDSLFNEENIKSINLLQKQFETEKKDKEIVEQKLLLQEQETDILNKKNENIFLITLASVFLVAGIGTLLFFQQRQKRKDQEILTLKKEKQVNSLESLIRGEEKERARIAKDLHDGVNGDLSAIKHRLSKYQNQTGVDLNEAISMIDDSCDEVRAISHNLLPPSLEKYSLRESLSDYCMNLDELRKEQVSFQYVGEDFKFSKTAKVTLFRIVQELLNNSLKHAKATDVMVQLTSFEDTIQLTVEDDGSGFKEDEIKSPGLGLENVKSRTEYLNGDLDMQSGKDGTHFNFIFNKLSLHES